MRPTHIKEPPQDAKSPPNAPAAPVRVVSTQELFGGCPRLWIEHAAERYLLQITRSGKLILTK